MDEFRQQLNAVFEDVVADYRRAARTVVGDAATNRIDEVIELRRIDRKIAARRRRFSKLIARIKEVE